ncbi:MAG: excinuclease ABC subunit UvrA, partial [Pseudomonadota bacterium]
MSLKSIRVVGAREHNLKNITLEIPRDQLVVMTGLSGSGKSSLAFDTIYAEGQRRYVESLSAYARQFLEMMQKPDVDQIEGLSPAISIEQKTTSRNPRSTVGTVTEIYDYMRLLWARIGVPFSPATGLPITSQTVTEMVDRLLAEAEGARFYLLAPMIRARKGEYRKEFAELQKKGFQRVKVDGTYYEIADVPALNKKLKHDIDVVVDRIIVKKGIESRLAESFETALALADGIAIAESADAPPILRDAVRKRAAPQDEGASGKKRPHPEESAQAPFSKDEGAPHRIIFSAKFACPVSGFTIDEIEPRLFSFNAPAGACPKCDGLGTQMVFDEELVIPDPGLTLNKGAVGPWAKGQSPYYMQTLEALGKKYKFKVTAKWSDLTQKQRDIILYGTGEEEVAFIYQDGARKFETVKPFEGVIPNLERRYRETDSSWVREELSRFQAVTSCEACKGFRLKPEALAVKIANLNISEATELSIRAADRWFTSLEKVLSKKEMEIAARVLKEIRERLHFLNNVGLDYLTLGRASGTLSGGESQRIRLASQIGSGLTGVLYVLDEPSIGLHQRDNARLLETLKRLRDLGNSVLVVEHDEDAIRTADYVVDIGPGAGIHGGEIIAEGDVAAIMKEKRSITGDYLAGRR